MEDQRNTDCLDLVEVAKAFEVEELEERLEFGSWTLYAEGNSNGSMTAGAKLQL
ncbi:hypothetical protein SAMN04488109_3771 [Chryseolinea serpens]|uniref:Uncharacterized protein n=1 Tax=Chryseolinea serpens TaxID=947013 RepID=A0A1M5S6E4_9BACT|nr:hypothetical protein [Chryseolinea serpens]SHH34059.1 hypothetical protein SAMN04488109_3771 [Chryseolinea serpens]